MLYLLLKWLHVLSAVIALGSNFTYGIWLGRASRKPEALSFTLRGIKLIDDRLANPAYGIALVTGFLMVHEIQLPLSTPWLLTSLSLFGVILVVSVLGYTPTLKRQIRALESDGPASSAYQSLARRGTMIGIFLAVLTMIVLFLMVVKPALWT